MFKEGSWMPPRRKKRKTSRRRFTGINVLKAAEAYALTSIWTEAAFNVNPLEFLTGTVNGNYKPGADGSTVITLPELFGAGPGGLGGNYSDVSAGGKGGFIGQVESNLGGIQGIATTALKSAITSGGFRLVSRLTRKPRSMFNSQLRMLGVGDMVRV